MESEIKFSPANSAQSFALFIECNTNDLYIASYLKSSNTMGFSNFFVLGAGMKLKF